MNFRLQFILIYVFKYETKVRNFKPFVRSSIFDLEHLFVSKNEIAVNVRIKSALSNKNCDVTQYCSILSKFLVSHLLSVAQLLFGTENERNYLNSNGSLRQQDWRKVLADNLQ